MLRKTVIRHSVWHYNGYKQECPLPICIKHRPTSTVAKYGPEVAVALKVRDSFFDVIAVSNIIQRHYLSR